MRFPIGLEELSRSRKWRRRAQRTHNARRFNTPLDQVAAAGGTTSPPPPPAAATSPPPPPPAAASPPPPPAATTPTAGSGTSGLPTPGATPAAAAPGPAAAAPLPFEQDFQRRYGMSPDQAQMLMHLGYQHYRGQGQPASQPGQQPPQQTANVFGLPKFDYRLLDFVAKNPQTGRLEPLPGAPPDAVLSVEAFQAQLRQAQQGFFEDPMKFLEKPIADLVEKRALELYQKQFGQHQSQSVAQRIIAENGSWLFEKDAQGNPVQQFDPATGRMANVPTAWGRYYHQCVQQVANSGVSDTEAQHRYAMQMVENAALRAKYSQSNAAPAGNAAAATFLNNAAANPPGPTSPPTLPPPPAASPNTPTTMRDRLQAAFDREGLDDRALRAQMNGSR